MSSAEAASGGRLYVCAVPIGNLEDASPRLRRILGEVGAIACEDTRTTRKLLTLLGIDATKRLLAHHEHNEREGAAGIVALLAEGMDVALVSDAGTPAVSDPGVPLVRAALDAEFEVHAVPGPSAVAAAVSVAGIAGGGYRFAGFLSRSTADTQRLVQEGAHDLLVAFESPSRIGASVQAIADVQPGREVVVCRELTKLHESQLRGTAASVAAELAGVPVKGEIVLVLEPMSLPARDQEVEPSHLALVQGMIDAGVRHKDAARLVSEHLGGSSRALYDAVLAARDV